MTNDCTNGQLLQDIENSTQNFPLVELVSKPDSSVKTIYVACRTCYSELYPQEIWKEDHSNDKMLTLIRKVMCSGHHSTLEHCQFVFAISGISRACSHQLVRHRHMSFSQKSQRYVTEKNQFEFIVPPSVKNSPFIDEYIEFMKTTQAFYSRMIEHGIKAEDARFILPNAASTSMLVSLNLRELIHLANLRLCTNAQHEIRKLVQKMVDLVINEENWLSEYLVIKCETMGYCNEIRSCGKYPQKPEV